MFRFRSLQSRMTTLYTATFGIVMLLVALSMQWVVEQQAEQKVRSELSASASTIDRIWSLQQRELESVAEPLAHDFGFREAVASMTRLCAALWQTWPRASKRLMPSS